MPNKYCVSLFLSEKEKKGARAAMLRFAFVGHSPKQIYTLYSPMVTSSLVEYQIEERPNYWVSMLLQHHQRKITQCTSFRWPIRRLRQQIFNWLWMEWDTLMAFNKKKKSGLWYFWQRHQLTALSGSWDAAVLVQDQQGRRWTASPDGTIYG